MTDLVSIAKEVSTVDEAIMKALPIVGTVIGFVPGAAPAEAFMPLIGSLLAAVDNAAQAVEKGNPGAAATDILQEIINHLTPGKPNSPILSG